MFFNLIKGFLTLIRSGEPSSMVPFYHGLYSKTLRPAKPVNGMFKNETGYNIGGERFSRSGFCPSDEIYNCSNYILCSRMLGWSVNGSYKLKNPFSKWLKRLNWVQGKLIPS